MTRRVFISYARDDRNLASELAAQLENAGFVVWWDWQLIGGVNYRDKIHNELRNADKIVVLWSAHSVKSDFVIDEASIAKTLGKLIPISIDGSAPPLGFGSMHTLTERVWSPLPIALSAALSETAPPTAQPYTFAHQVNPIPRTSIIKEWSGAIEFAAIDYIRWFMAMIVQPSRIIRRTRDAMLTEQSIGYLIRIAAISILVGATIGALIPDRPPLLGRTQVFIVVACLWLFLSLLVHGVCRLLGGKEGVGTTVILMLQSLAFAYVVSNFITLLFGVVTKYYQPITEYMTSEFGGFSPGYMLLGLQFILLLYLVPATVSQAHGFKGFRWLAVALCAAAFTVFLGLPTMALGGC